MKQQIFNDYVDEVSHIFGIDKEMLFTKNKRRDIVSARYLVYYLCSLRPMSLVNIGDLMMENGYSIKHSTIHYGVDRVKQRILTDKDWNKSVKAILDEV
jgi:chromosomal replication initiation ATPase DnaA|tara:strand:- start:400 stop:696 length:297 start_codon:yes stop_codon:yes gene_type:complete